MHTAWETESAAERFMKRLVRERACEFMRSPDYLRPLRFDFERAKRDQKRFGEIWAEYGTTSTSSSRSRTGRRGTRRTRRSTRAPCIKKMNLQ